MVFTISFGVLLLYYIVTTECCYSIFCKYVLRNKKNLYWRYAWSLSNRNVLPRLTGVCFNQRKLFIVATYWNRIFDKTLNRIILTYIMCIKYFLFSHLNPVFRVLLLTIWSDILLHYIMINSVLILIVFL